MTQELNNNFQMKSLLCAIWGTRAKELARNNKTTSWTLKFIAIIGMGWEGWGEHSQCLDGTAL